MIKKSLITLSLMAVACTMHAQLPSADVLQLTEKPEISYFKAAKQASAKASSTTVKTVPYVATFLTEDMFNAFTVINANNDQKSNGKECTWYFNEDLQTARYSYSGENQADDWLISPAIALEAGSNYTLTVNCKNYKSAYYGDYEEKFEVKLGTLPTVDAMSQVIMSKKTVKGGTFKNFVNTDIAVAETGIYYIGVHCVSDAYRGELDVKSIQLDVVPNDNAPAACTDVDVEADPTGEASATLSFKAPTTTYAGTALTGTLSVRIRRNGEDIKVFENVTPGQSLTYVDSDNVPNGNNNYRIIAYNDAGVGDIDEETVFVGVDVPKAVTNVNITEPNANSLTLTWDPVDVVGENGQVVNPEKVIYFIYSTLQSGSSIAYDEQLGYVKGETSFTFPYNNDEGTQKRKYWAVIPVTVAGTGESALCSYYVGKPNTLPFEEHLTTTAFQHDTWSYSVSTTKYVILSLTELSSDGDDNALIFYTEQAGNWGKLTAGKISLKDAENPALTFDTFTSSDINQLHINIITPDGETHSFARFIPTESYKTYRFDLSEFKNERYIRFEIYADFKAAGAFCFDNICVTDVKSGDLSLRLEIPATARMGVSDTKVKAIVRNESNAAISSFALSLTSGNVVIADETINATIEPLESYTGEFLIPISLLKKEKKITINGEVILDADQNTANNTAKCSTTVVSSKLPEPTEVTITEESNSATLNWDEPDNYDTVKTEDFEDQSTFPPFSLGDLTNQAGSFGDWNVYDGDNLDNYGYNSYKFENNTEPSAWQVMNPGMITSLLDDYDNYEAHSGEQYLVAWCPGSGEEADNWLISPELPGTSQKITFYYAVENDAVGSETFDILASTTNNAYTSFTTLVKSFEVDNLYWEKATVTLPEGTKYFAIHHTSADVFGVMIDDITYTAGAKTQLGYNIYLDGALLTTLPTTTKTYTFENVSSSEGHTFGVSAVYANDLESDPVSFSNAAGIENVLSNKPAAAGVAYDLYGRRVSPDTKGLIIVDGKKIVNK
jgi:hypothetical protein